MGKINMTVGWQSWLNASTGVDSPIRLSWVTRKSLPSPRVRISLPPLTGGSMGVVKSICKAIAMGCWVLSMLLAMKAYEMDRKIDACYLMAQTAVLIGAYNVATRERKEKK